MTSLIFYTDENQALVVTDTLAVRWEDGAPLLFATKAHYLPHLQMIIAGTGICGFSDEWITQVNTRMILRGIEDLNNHAPEILREFWSHFQAMFSTAIKSTTTIYHFGISENTGKIMGIAYRSANNFEPHRLEYGTGVKPECSVPTGNLFDNLQAMMEEQRQRQSEIPDSERVHIGGQAFSMHLTADGCSITKAFEFADFNAQMTQALVLRS